MHAQYREIRFHGVGVISVDMVYLHGVSPDPANAAGAVRLEQDLCRQFIVDFDSH
jgi:hypothetical protein